MSTTTGSLTIRIPGGHEVTYQPCAGYDLVPSADGRSARYVPKKTATTAQLSAHPARVRAAAPAARGTVVEGKIPDDEIAPRIKPATTPAKWMRNAQLADELFDRARGEADVFRCAVLVDRALELRGAPSRLRDLSPGERGILAPVVVEEWRAFERQTAGLRKLSITEECAALFPDPKQPTAALSAKAENKSAVLGQPHYTPEAGGWLTDANGERHLVLRGAAATAMGLLPSGAHPSDYARARSAELAKLEEVAEAARKRAPAADPDAEAAHRVTILRSFAKRTA